MLVIVFLIVVFFLDTVTTVMPFVARFYAERTFDRSWYNCLFWFETSTCALL